MASPPYLAHNSAIDCGSFWANHMNFLADTRDNGKVLREVRCQNPRNPVGVQVFQLTQLYKGANIHQLILGIRSGDTSIMAAATAAY